MSLRGPAPTPSVKKLSPIPMYSPQARLVRLLAPQVRVPGQVHRDLQGAGVVA